MKLSNLLCLGALSALALTACTDNDDNSTWNDGTQPISFDATIGKMATRAQGSAWEDGDKVGVFMNSAAAELAANKQYVASATGTLTAAGAEDALYYPTDGTTVDFLAYYPYATLSGNTYKVNVAEQSKPAAIDLLYSDNAKGFSKSSATAPALEFNHQLSQIVFNITKDNTVPSLEGLAITFKGFNTTADFALADGTLNNAATPADIKAVVTAAGDKAAVIVLPAAALTGVTLEFTLSGKTFVADYPQAELAAGTKYTHNVSLSDQNGQPTITLGEATISDWTDVAGSDIEVDFGEGGSEETPSEVTLLDEPFNANQGAFTIKDVQLPEGSTYVWKWSSYTDGTQYMKASSYINKAQKASESWLISPALDMTNATAATLTFEHCHKFGADKLSEMTLWIAEDGTENWTQLTIPTYGSGNDYTYVTATVDLTAHVGKKAKIAFKYLSTDAAGATWQINSVKVTATTTGGGSVDPTPDPEPGQEKVIFEETCGDAVPLTTKIKINAYTDWDNSNLTFFDRFAGEYQNGDVRKSSTTTNHVWFPASTETMNKSAALKISGFDVSGYTNLVLTYEITANAAADQNIIKVDCGGTTMEVPSASLSQNVFSTVTLSNVPDGIEYIEFISDETNTFGFRIDSIKLVGTAK